MMGPFDLPYNVRNGTAMNSIPEEDLHNPIEQPCGQHFLSFFFKLLLFWFFLDSFFSSRTNNDVFLFFFKFYLRLKHMRSLFFPTRERKSAASDDRLGGLILSGFAYWHVYII
jgi:hypothetical protein